MGFVSSFLNLPERRATLSIADQLFFDLFSEKGVQEMLQQVVMQQDGTV
jgi:hypothetical protein